MKALVQTYLQALYTRNWDQVLDMLHEGDMQRSYEITRVMAEVMEPFGETQGFLQHSGISSLEGLETSDLQIEGERARMQYRLPNPFWEGDYLESEIHFAKVGEEWKILFKPGIVDVWLNFQQEVDLYHERKARDQVDEGEDVKKKREGEMLTPFLLWGYKDAEGKVVIEPRFKQAEAFQEGLAVVQIFQKFGYLNSRGELAIQPAFDQAEGFSEGLARVCVYSPEFERQWGLIDHKGETVLPLQYEDALDCSEGRAAVCDKGRWGFVDAQGEWVIPAEYEDAQLFSEGLAAVQQDDLWGYLDRKGHLQIDFRFAQAGPFEEGVAEVGQFVGEDYELASIDSSGKILG